MGDEVRLELQHAFGSLCGSSLREPCVFADSAGQQIAFIVGRQLALRHVESNETTFRTVGERVDLLTACCASRDRSFLALAEKSGEAKVAIFDLKSGNSGPVKMVRPFGGAARVLSLAFSGSHEGGAGAGSAPKYLLAASQGPEPTLALMNWDAEKVLCKVKLSFQVDRICFPQQPDILQVTASGPQGLRLLQIRHAKGEVSLKLMPPFSNLPDDQRILDHTWLGTTVALCVQEGFVHLLNTEELILLQSIEFPFGQNAEIEDLTPLCIRALTGGFVVGGSSGYIAMWELAEEEDGSDASALAEEYKLATAAKVRPESDAVSSLDISPGEESLLLGFADADIGIVSISTLYSSEEVTCHVIGNHSAAITGMDLAVHRPLLLTASKGDGTVRVWNCTSRTCEIRAAFGEDPHAVAVHPFGYYAAVAFAEKLRLYHILVKDLKQHTEIHMRGIQLLKFSPSGHLLAVCQGKVIHIYSVRNLAKVVTLQGHSQDVTGLSFDPEDRSLWSIEDGRLIEWSLATWGIEANVSEPGVHRLAVSAIAQDQATCSVLRKGKQVLQRFSQHSFEFETELEMSKITALCHFPGSGAFFAATAKGSLQVFLSLPALGPPKSYELQLHGMACTALCLSIDGRSLVTAGEDGVIFMLQVHGLSSQEELTLLPLPLHTTDMDKYSPELESVLASKEEILKLEKKCQSLMAECRNMKERLEREAQQHEEECAAKVLQARQKDQAEIQELERRLEALEMACTAKDRESQRQMKAMEQSHGEAVEQLSNLYQRKLCHESDRLLDLQLQKEKLQQQMVKEEEEHQERLKQSAAVAKEEMQRLLQERDLEIKKHQDLLAFVQHRFEEIREQTAQEHDAEAMRLKHSGWEALEQQKQVEEQLHREQENLLRGLEMQEKDREAVEEKQQEAASTLKSLREQAEELRRTLQSLHGEREDRAATLAEKEGRIEGYKSKERTLKRFKLLLDKKLAEVVESVQPKDQLIEKLNQDLGDLEGEFERQLSEQRSLDAQIGQRKQQAAILTQESQKLKDQLKELDAQIFRFKNDLHTLVTQKELKDWPKEIRKLYHTHVCEDTRQDRLPLEEMMRTMRVVERQVTSLAAKSNQIRDMGKTDMQRKANENATLVHELNQLRMHKCSLVREVRALKTKLKLNDQESKPKAVKAAPAPAPLPSKVREPSGSPAPRPSPSRELLEVSPSRSQKQLEPL
ncbi:unnamed protein product [Effrenium voratum]|nr:unnamed protein product [Effrenium voratum]